MLGGVYVDIKFVGSRHLIVSLSNDTSYVHVNLGLFTV